MSAVSNPSPLRCLAPVGTCLQGCSVLGSRAPSQGRTLADVGRLQGLCSATTRPLGSSSVPVTLPKVTKACHHNGPLPKCCSVSTLPRATAEAADVLQHEGQLSLLFWEGRVIISI